MKPDNTVGNPSSDGTTAVSPTTDEERELSRRKILSALAKMGIVAAAAGTAGIVGYREEAAAAPMTNGPSPKAQDHEFCTVIDLRVCDGCGACTQGCQTRHQLPKDVTWIKVYKMTDVSGSDYFMPRPCMHCQDAPCIRVCPTGANFHRPEGMVLVDQDACIGSRACMAACPYEARYFNWEEPPPMKLPIVDMPRSPEWPVPQVKGTVGKCVMCADRILEGELPACTMACPMGALYNGDFVTDIAVNGRGHSVKLSQFLAENDAVRFKEELGTDPRVYYILGHGQDLSSDVGMAL